MAPAEAVCRRLGGRGLPSDVGRKVLHVRDDASGAPSKSRPGPGDGQTTGETVRVSAAELQLVRRLLFASGNLAIAVLESDAALVADEILEKARHLQALYGELAG